MCVCVCVCVSVCVCGVIAVFPLTPIPPNTNTHALTCVVVLDLAGQPKVADLAAHFTGNQNVSRRHVAVDESERMHVRQALAAVARPQQLLLHRHLLLLKIALEGTVLHKLEHNVHGVAHRDHANQLHHKGALKLRHHRRLLQQLLPVCVGCLPGRLHARM